MATKHTLKRNVSESLFEKAKTYFPGGVNSPVRAFKSVDGAPLFMKKGDGCFIWDEDDNKFIDFLTINGYQFIIRLGCDELYKKIK